MARAHFGTDGVRGIVGETLTLDLVERFGRAATMWAGRGRVFVGRDTRSSGPALEQAVTRGIVSAGGTAVLGRRVADPRGGAARSGSRHRPLGLAQPAGVQRDQVLRCRGPQARRTRTRRRSRRCSTPGGRGRLGRGGGRCPGGLCRPRPRALRCAPRRAQDSRRLCQRRLLCDRARRVRAARRRGDDGRSVPGRLEHQRGLRRHRSRPAARRSCGPAATTSVSRSTATATGCWPSTRPGRRSTGTRFSQFLRSPTMSTRWP